MRKSPFPEDFLGVDLFYDGAWQPLGDDLDQSGVRVSHGARSEGSRSEVSSLSFRVTNSDGQYSPRNPTSPLYGLVGRNTPARARVDLGATWLDLSETGAIIEGAPGANASTGLDLRWWGSREDWSLHGDLMSKYGPSGDRAWLFRVEHFTNGNLPTLYWSPNGTSTFFAQAFVGVPDWAGEIVLRAVLTYDNGSGTGVVRFEHGTSINGPWVQLGPEVELGQVASLHESTEPIRLGRNPNGSGIDVPQNVYGFQVRDGDGGAVLAEADFSTDTLPEWTFVNAEITNTHLLAVGEVAEWPVDWNTKGAPSVLTEVQASGVSRRLGQGAQAVDSVLYRTIFGIEGLVGYWPMEDGRDATQLGVAVGSSPAAFRDGVTPASYESFPGSAPIPNLGGRIAADVDLVANTGAVQVRWVQFTPDESFTGGDVDLCRIGFKGGTISRVDVRMRDSDGTLGVFGYDEDGVLIGQSSYISSESSKGKNQRLSLELEQNGSSVDWRWVRLTAGETSGTVGSWTFTGSHTLGRVNSIVLNKQNRSLTNFAAGHLTFENEITSIFDIFGPALVGYAGEKAGDRMLRLADENGVGVVRRGARSAALGEQQEETLLDLMSESAEADGGMLHDDQHELKLRFRSLAALYDQPAVVIPYQDNLVIPFTPTDDDRLTRNRVTVQRTDGSRSTRELTAGAMSINPPPDGVGLYDTTLTLNLHTDEQTDPAASWLLHVGTWDEGRYPTLGVDLAHPYFLGNPALTRRLLALTPGDRVVITDPPPWLPPRSVDVLVMGIQADVTPHNLRLRWTCVPARPYRAARWNAGHRWSGAGTVTAEALDTTATAFDVTPPSGVAWTHVDGDYDITIGGEQMTVTSVAGNTLTVTRSVNGVVKAHSAGAAVELAEPSFYAR